MKLLIILFSVILFSCNSYSDLNIKYPSGGYDFSENIINKDFYCYPLINKVSRRDSFWKVYYDAHLLKLFKEPNISLEPFKKPIVRLVCSGRYVYVISLTENAIIIKASNDNSMPRFDYSKLSENERMHFIILKRDYPLGDSNQSNIAQAPAPPPGPLEVHEKKLDSIRKNTAILLKREYYDYLLKKAALKDTFSFSTKKIEITKKEFIKFITILNQSGYWSLPYDITSEFCSGATDAGFLSLEINTGKKYNYVESLASCVDTTQYYKVCQELLKMAKIDDKTILL